MDIESDDNLQMALQPRCSGVAFRALILCGVISAANTFGQTDRTQLFEREDDYLRSESATHFFRGTVLVGIDGKIVFEKAYGLGDEEWGADNTVHTEFRIASLGKQFAAACILLLEERGRLNVHDPISRYLSAIPVAWRAITVHQLLTHTSGIPNYTSSPEIGKINRTGATPQQMIGSSQTSRSTSRPARIGATPTPVTSCWA